VVICALAAPTAIAETSDKATVFFNVE